MPRQEVLTPNADSFCESFRINGGESAEACASSFVIVISQVGTRRPREGAVLLRVTENRATSELEPELRALSLCQPVVTPRMGAFPLPGPPVRSEVWAGQGR